jgi:hypothetical protein
MENLRELYSRTGFRACLVSGEKVIDEFLLTEEEKQDVSKLIPVLKSFPVGFKIGVVEFDGKKFGIAKTNGFVVVPLRDENIGEFRKKIEEIK